MTPFYRSLLYNCLRFFDLMVIAASLVLAIIAVNYRTGGISLLAFLGMRARVENFGLFLFFLLGGHIGFSAFGLYQSRRLSACGSEILDILKATVLGSGALWIVALIGNLSILTPRFLAVFFTTTSLLMIISHVSLRWMLARIRLRGQNLRNMLIVGTNSRAVGFAKDIEARPELGYRIVGFVDNEWAGTGQFHQNGYALVANIANFQGYISSNVVDEVVIYLPIKSLYQTASDIVTACEEQGLVVRFLPDIFNPHLARPETETLDEDLVVTLHATPIQGWPASIKRLLDIIISSMALILATPIMILAALLIKATSPGSVLFIQTRNGLSKRPFKMLKFRTMVANADKMTDSVAHLNTETGPAFKIRNDPRVTPIGRLLRKTSIDELPQLINVLSGQMSLVGPRPLFSWEYERIENHWIRRRFAVKPGLTGLWQVSGRSNLTFEKRIQMDLYYIDHWNLFLDFKILLQTIPTVFLGKGAT